LTPDRKLPWDWYPGTVPENVSLHEEAYMETTYSFHLFRSGQPCGVDIRRGASTYLGTMFDVGPKGKVSLGEFALVHGAHIICDEEITIGDYALISWNVVLMDSYRLSREPALRRSELQQVATRADRRLSGQTPPRPIRIERNVWIGFDAVVLPGVTIGEGAIVGTRSVVRENVPPFTIVAGNPARVIREIPRDVDTHHGN
jgi:acetyltransferase-like isoleucine patch superfamily enzyme